MIRVFVVWRSVKLGSPGGAAALLVALALAACSGETPGGFNSTNRCAGVVCEAADACHEPGVCSPATGQCTRPAKANGTSCEDGDDCTVDDACMEGTCTGTPFVCEALNECHVPGVCRAGECTNPQKADGSACDDGSVCTTQDSCVGGQCQGASSVVCEAQDACHDAGKCDPHTGVCSNPAKADGAACEDGDRCTLSDVCRSGACVAGEPVTCSPLNDCHDPGACDSATGECTNPPKADGSVCDDRNPCTTQDTCQAGACAGGGMARTCPASACHEAGSCNPANGQCEAAPKADGTACDDGNACTRTDACQSGVCTGGNPVVCTAADGCHLAGACNVATGACSSPAKADGSVCNDGNACTQTDSCVSGSCQGSNPVTCAGADQCHDGGTCNPASGLCSGPAKPDGTVCSDNNACSAGDTCQGGDCVPGPAVVCTAADQCHAIGTCDPGTGVCSTPVKAAGTSCDDGNACTQTDSCQLGVCTGDPSPNDTSCGEPGENHVCRDGSCVPP